MILLNGTICSKDFRKAGIMNTCFNLVVQVVLMIVVINLLNKHVRDDYYGYEYVLKNIYIIALSFIILDIILYSILVLGLAQRKPSILMVWLCFAPSELIIVQVTLFWCVFAAAGLTVPLYGILTIIGDTLVIAYLFYNMCVIHSARNAFIKQPQLRSGAVHYVPQIAGPSGNVTVAANPPMPQYMFVTPMPNTGGYIQNPPQYQQTDGQPSYLK